MAGLVPAIHVFLAEDVDARDKPGHDDLRYHAHSIGRIFSPTFRVASQDPRNATSQYPPARFSGRVLPLTLPSLYIGTRQPESGARKIKQLL
jgi:hypothetical protein